MHVVGYRCRNVRECSLIALTLSLKWGAKLSAESRNSAYVHVCMHLCI